MTFGRDSCSMSRPVSFCSTVPSHALWSSWSPELRLISASTTFQRRRLFLPPMTPRGLLPMRFARHIVQAFSMHVSPLELQSKASTMRRIFISYAANAKGTSSFTDGTVHVVPRSEFTRMPSYKDSKLGWITECQWVSQSPVPVIYSVDVSRTNLPLVPRSHDASRIRELSRADPAGFPWLEHEPNQ